MVRDADQTQEVTHHSIRLRCRARAADRRYQILGKTPHQPPSGRELPVSRDSCQPGEDGEDKGPSLISISAWMDSPSLPGWIAQVEKENTSKAVPSAQFWKELRASLALDCVIRCSPLVAPSSFPMAQNGQGEGWGFNLPPPSCIIYSLLVLHLSAAPEQWHVCQSLRADKCWYALTRGSTLDSSTKEKLISLGMVLRVFRRGTSTAAAKGCWRLAKLKTVITAQDWTLWSSRAAAGSEASQEQQNLLLSSICLTDDGVVSLELARPSAQEVLRGPMVSVYAYEGVVVTTDG
jgi:hypothetical protein